jgi:hypothetical protein
VNRGREFKKRSSVFQMPEMDGLELAAKKRPISSSPKSIS